MVENKLRGKIQPRPGQEEAQRAVALRVGRDMGECAVENLELGKVRQRCKVIPKDVGVQRRLEGLPLERLGCLALAQGVQDPDLQAAAAR